MHYAQNVIACLLRRAPSHQPAHRMRHDNHLAQRYPVLSLLVPVHDFVDALDQAIGCHLVAVEPVIAARPYRVVVVAQPPKFVVGQRWHLCASDRMPVILHNVNLLVVTAGVALKFHRDRPGCHRLCTFGSCVNVLVVQRKFELRENAAVAIEVHLSPAAAFRLLFRERKYAARDANRACIVYLHGVRTHLLFPVCRRLPRAAQPLAQARQLPIGRRPRR